MFAADRRRGCVLVAALLVSAATAATARVQSPQKRANSLNDEGKALLFATPPNYEGAAAKFRQAIVLSPEGRFYFNLCVSEYSVGDFGNALMACQAVDANTTDEKTKKNANDLVAKIREQMKNQGMNPDAVKNTPPDNGNPNNGNPNNGNPNNGNPNNGNPNNGNPNNGNPNNGNPNNGNPNNGNPNNGMPNNGNPNNANPNPNPQYAQFRGAPPPSLFQMTPPSHDYTYTFGGALEAGGASIGDTGAYGGGAAGFRLFGDLMFAPAAKLGGEGYIDFMQV